MIKIILKKGKEEPLLRYHPWVFSGAIQTIEGDPADGDVVEVCHYGGAVLAVGHFHHGSIAVRVLHFGAADVQQLSFWTSRLESAFAVRQSLGLVGSRDTTCYRLVHGEGDDMSGLVVDVYNDTAVLQCHSIGMHRQRELLAQALRAVLGEHLHIFDKSAETLPPKYAATIRNGYLGHRAGQASTVVLENNVRFHVDWENGQKTGFFLDQRDNRLLLTRFVKGKTVLNAYCYTGGFSVYALSAGAHRVHSVDISPKAMELTAKNVALNAPCAGEHEGFCTDVLSFLSQNTQPYEVMVIDPPAFAKSLDKRHNAVQGYKRLNALALRNLSSQGILFTFSCSQVVDKALFYNTVMAAAVEAGRRVRVLQHLSQGGDHPVSIFHPEGAYLKGLVLFVE